MIVKNETKVLPRLFRSVKDVIDSYVIVDTGSSDDTIALIGRLMQEYGIDGEVHERPWVNFGVNRQQALELAVQAARADWLLFIDADEELGVSDPRFYEKLEPGISYDIEKHHAGTRYSVPHLIDIKHTKWKWEGPVHNYLVTLEGKRPRKRLDDIWIIYHSGQGAKSHGMTQEQKYLRDAKLLEDHLLENPDSARSQFYLGQSYKHAGHHDKALAAYKKRVTMKGWVEETFMAQLEVGRVSVLMKLPEEVVLRELLAAYELRPRRAEPLYELARYYRTAKAYAKAALFARAGLAVPRPADQLFVARDVYDWRLQDELAVSSYWIGCHAESKTACEHVLGQVEAGKITLNERDLRRVRENLAFAEKKLSG